MGSRRIICAVTRGCVACRHVAGIFHRVYIIGSYQVTVQTHEIIFPNFKRGANRMHVDIYTLNKSSTTGEVPFLGFWSAISGISLATFEELVTMLAQVQACLNSTPLAPLPQSEDGIEVLTPSHFLAGWSLEALPNLSETSKPISALRR